ncbi:MAG: NUDIX hydrolase [Bacteroidales bacterium]|nr:NUDIX hydrolase [Bacteroidales bacterium]MDY4175097.1 NUDIX domain-containing protein [Bacteroidales bacterium]
MKLNEQTKKWESDFWHPSVATDAVVFGFNVDTNSLDVLLIQRGVEPFKGMWALPGGFLKQGESAEECVKRELGEETRVENLYMEQIGAFSEPGRDTGHDDQVISIAFFALVRSKDYEVVGGDDATKAVWFPVGEHPELAFDHEEILQKALSALRQRIHFAPIGFQLLDEEFTMPQLQNIYIAILDPEGKDSKLRDRRNFQKKMLNLGYIKDTGGKVTGNPHRSPKKYAFDRDAYGEAKKVGMRLEF